MRRPALAVLVLASACTASKPLPEAILGEWEVWCRTDKEATASCPGQEERDLYKRFQPGGVLVAGAHSGISMTGTWTLDDAVLVVAFKGGGLHLEETYRARVEDDRLVLWDSKRGHGEVHGRVDAPFVAAPSRRSTDGHTTHAIGGLDYRLALPTDYALTRDDNNRQTWSPAGGDGLAVHLTLAPRAQMLVDGAFVTPPCEPADAGMASETTEIAGVQRVVSLGLSRCIDGADTALSCSVDHPRGHLEPAEEETARALCESLSVDA